eukprot:UN11717
MALIGTACVCVIGGYKYYSQKQYVRRHSTLVLYQGDKLEECSSTSGAYGRRS